MTPETERKHNPYTQCQSPVGIPQVDEDALLSETDGNQDWSHSEGNQAEGKLDAIMGDPVLLTECCGDGWLSLLFSAGCTSSHYA